MNNTETETAPSILRYLKSIPNGHKRFFYLELDDEQCVVSRGGQLEIHELSGLDSTVSLDVPFDLLCGLWPIGGDPYVILNFQFSEGLYMDLHLFNDAAGNWLLLMENRYMGFRRQAKQQSRLNSDLEVSK